MTDPPYGNSTSHSMARFISLAIFAAMHAAANLLPLDLVVSPRELVGQAVSLCSGCRPDDINFAGPIKNLRDNLGYSPSADGSNGDRSGGNRVARTTSGRHLKMPDALGVNVAPIAIKCPPGYSPSTASGGISCRPDENASSLRPLRCAPGFARPVSIASATELCEPTAALTSPVQCDSKWVWSPVSNACVSYGSGVQTQTPTQSFLSSISASAVATSLAVTSVSSTTLLSPSTTTASSAAPSFTAEYNAPTETTTLRATTLRATSTIPLPLFASSTASPSSLVDRSYLALSLTIGRLPLALARENAAGILQALAAWLSAMAGNDVDGTAHVLTSAVVLASLSAPPPGPGGASPAARRLQVSAVASVSAPASASVSAPPPPSSNSTLANIVVFAKAAALPALSATLRGALANSSAVLALLNALAASAGLPAGSLALLAVSGSMVGAAAASPSPSTLLGGVTASGSADGSGPNSALIAGAAAGCTAALAAALAVVCARAQAAARIRKLAASRQTTRRGAAASTGGAQGGGEDGDSIVGTNPMHALRDAERRQQQNRAAAGGAASSGGSSGTAGGAGAAAVIQTAAAASPSYAMAGPDGDAATDAGDAAVRPEASPAGGRPGGAAASSAAAIARRAAHGSGDAAAAAHRALGPGQRFSLAPMPVASRPAAKAGRRAAAAAEGRASLADDEEVALPFSNPAFRE